MNAASEILKDINRCALALRLALSGRVFLQILRNLAAGTMFLMILVPLEPLG